MNFYHFLLAAFAIYAMFSAADALHRIAAAVETIAGEDE
ncbi:hypothetical protein SAMN05443248_3030 [Bradyrhizobium erythrophlei]|uniref:Uncharacterized protein n=1 Tax=Bradyrhizobium erythrophlei TaxID=1437360 RepID=A0A1M5NM51_9BRAD|nr:hypothetical protein SAMN05443248_3030 [Bradyrhizobium erythrophlei]